MDVDAASSSKKRFADVPLEEIPFAKRTKFKELFPSVFSSNQEMDINTLKIQNRELVVKLAERTKALETANHDLAKSQDASATLGKSVSSFSIFMTQVLTEVQHLASVLPGAEKVEPAQADLLESFQQYVVADMFEATSLASVRQALVLLLNTVAKSVQQCMENHVQLTRQLESGDEGEKTGAQTSLKQAISQKFGDLRSQCGPMEKKTLELETQLADAGRIIDTLRTRNKEVTERLVRMLNHVARLEIEMDKIEERHEEEKRRLSANTASPSILMMKKSTSVMTPGEETATGSDGAAVTGENGSTEVVASVPLSEYQTLMTQFDDVNKELDTMKALSQSRLTEIESLRGEKVDLLRQSAAQLIPSASLDASTTSVGTSEETRVLKADLKAKVERVEQLLREIDDLNHRHAEAKRQLAETTQTQLKEVLGKLDRMTEKFKGMEGEKDKLYHQLVSARALNAESLSHLPHVATLEKELASVRAKLESAERRWEMLVFGSAENGSASTAPDATAIDLRDSLLRANAEIQLLRKEIALPTWLSAHTDENKKKLLLDAVASIARLTQELDEAKKREDEQKAFEDVVTDMQAENAKLASEVSEKDRRMGDLIKERVNAGAVTSSTKKLGQIEATMTSTAQAKDKATQKLLLAEKRISAAQKEEAERLKVESEKMRKVIVEYENVSANSAVMVEILKKRCEHLESQIKAQETHVAEAKVAAEEERGKKARVEEELVLAKSREASLMRSSSTQLSAAPSALTGDDKTAAYFRQMFKCGLCDGERLINVALRGCGHCFCKRCVDDKCLRSRNRKCPKCKKPISDSDVTQLYF